MSLASADLSSPVGGFQSELHCRISRPLPDPDSGHLQTIFSVIGNFNNVDKVEYQR